MSFGACCCLHGGHVAAEEAAEADGDPAAAPLPAACGAGGGENFGFALGRCEHQAAAHAVAAEDPSGGTAGEEQFFGLVLADELALLIADDDTRTARIGDAGQEVVGQASGVVLLLYGIRGEQADGRCDAVKLIPGLK